MGWRETVMERVYGSTQGITPEKIKSLFRRNLKLSAQDIAQELGIGRSTLFYLLKKWGKTLEDLRNEVLREIEEEKLRKLRRKEIREAVPATYEEFLQYETVKELRKKLETATTISDRQRSKILRFFYRLVKRTGYPPAFFLYGDREEVKKVVLDYLSRRKEEGIELNAEIANLQSIQKWLEINILPSWVEQQEYKGKFKTAELNMVARSLLVQRIIKNHDKRLADMTVRALCMLYWTGSRAESLKTFHVEGEIEIADPEITRVYQEARFIVVKTSEKGKKGRKIEWTKLVPRRWAWLLPRYRYTDKDLEKIRAVIRKELLALMRDYPELFNADTKAYVVDAKKTLHLMRHTSAREFLKAFRWNMYLVSKLLGWEKVENMKIYGDYGLLELLQARAQEHKLEFIDEETTKMLRRVLK